MKTYRLMLLGATAATVALISSAPIAQAGEVKKSVVMSGHVNRMIGVENDGNSTEFRHFDNSIEESRFGVTATAESANLTIQGIFEWTFVSNSNVAPGGTPNQAQGAGTGENDGERHSDIVFTTNYGTLWMGHGSAAADGDIEMDLSGTPLVLHSGQILSGGMGMTDTGDAGNIGTGTGGSFSSATYLVSALIPELNGTGRTNRVRYDTPSFGGAMLSISNDGGGAMSYSAMYEGSLGPIDVAAMVGHTNMSSTSTGVEDHYGTSISVLHTPSGVSLTYAYGISVSETDADAANLAGGIAAVNPRGAGRPTMHYGKLNYDANFFDLGATSMGVDVNIGYDGVTDGDYGIKTGVGFTQYLDDYGTEIYGTYEHVSGHRGNARGSGTRRAFQDINAGYFGAIVYW